MSETELSLGVAHVLERLGCIVIRVHSGQVRVGGGYMQCAPSGTPDRLVLMPGGRSCWLEIKEKHGKISIDQKIWMDRAARLGHRVAVVRSVSEAVDVIKEAMR
ncbi:MAG TPA: VRR-NUC domain-containing protein [Polyangiaceae bacterium]